MNGEIALSTAAAAGFELRSIIVLQGLQFTNADMASDNSIPEGNLQQMLTAAGTPLVSNPSGVWTLRSLKQGVIYSLRVANTKDELKAAFESSKKVHLIYLGHSRYGQGCCFGTDWRAGGAAWENGTDPKTGLYRMGYPYVAIPAKHLVEHDYTLDIVPASEKIKLVPHQCEFDVRRNLKYIEPHQLSYLPEEARGRVFINNAPVQPTDKFWAFHWGKEGITVITHAGWKKTVTKPTGMDLGATNIKCRVFCHFGCSSLQHFHEILRNRRLWKKVGNKDNFAYFTSDLASGATTWIWLYYLFTYSKYNAFHPWEPSLEYARKKANKYLEKVWIPQHHWNQYQIV